MTLRSLCLTLLLVGPVGSCSTIATAQGPATPAVVHRASRDSHLLPVDVRVQGPAIGSELQFDDRSYRRPVLRVGWDYLVRGGDIAPDVTVIAGDLTIDGTVQGDVVVVLGEAKLSSTAVITGDFIVVGGSATIAPGATVRRDLVVVGGQLDAPSDFAPGGEYIAIGLASLGDRLRSVVPWVAHGLLLGRPIVPWLPWVWYVVAGFFFVSLALQLVFGDAVSACVAVLARRPLSACLAGFLTLLLVGPIAFVLAVSVVGVAVIPFLICALVIAWTLGKTAVAGRIGRGIVHEQDPPGRLQTVRSFVIGCVLIVLAYTVPFLGIVVWVMVGVFGLGAAVLAFFAAFRRENPQPPPRVVARPIVVPPPPPAPAPVMASAEPAWTGTPSASEPAPPLQDVTGLLVFPHATFLDRTAAFALDLFLVLLAYQLLEVRGDSRFFLLLLAYFIAFWTWKGTTVGGIICQLRLVRVDGTALRFVDSLVRSLSSLFSFAVVGLGCLWILQDPERQAWHDKIAGTFVVKVPRNWPL